MKNTELRKKASNIINWSALSEQIAHNKDSIRANRIPDKYKEEVNILLSYIESWLNCKELTTKEELIEELEFVIGDKVKKLAKELQEIGNNPFINS